MSSIKCPRCGLVNWATADDCKRCKLPLARPTAPTAVAPVSGASAGGEHAHTSAPGGFATPPGADVSHEAPTPHGAPSHEASDDAPSHEAPHNGVATQQAPLPETSPHEASPPPGAYAPGRDWRSPYDLSGSDDDEHRLDIGFEVAPFVDTAMVIRDTYALTHSQFRLILRIVLTAIAPQILLILAFGAGRVEAPAGLPPGLLFFGAPPVAGHTGAPSPADFAGLFSFFLLLLLAYQFVRLAVMPSALIYGLVTTLNTGSTPGVAECFRWGLRRSFSAGFALMLSGVLIFFGLLLVVVPGVFLALSFSMVIPIIAIEGRGAVAAMGRSWDLSRGRRSTIFFSTCAWSVVVLLLTLVLTFFIGVVAAVLRSSVIGSITTAFVVEVLGATGIVLSLVVYLGIAHYGQPAPPRPDSARTTIIVLIIIGLIVLAGAAAVVASVAVPNFKASVRAANEGSAISKLRKVVAAEETFFVLENRYGTLRELAEKDLIDDELARGTVNGYRFEVSVVGGTYEATATPVTYGTSGTRSFYASSDGVVRVADKRGRKAGADDMPLNEYRPPKSPRRTDSPIIDPGGQAW